MSKDDIKKALGAWPLLAEIIFVPHTKDEYNSMVSLLDELIDEVGEDEKHPYASLMEIVGALIERYEEEHVPELTSEKQSVS